MTRAIFARADAPCVVTLNITEARALVALIEANERIVRDYSLREVAARIVAAEEATFAAEGFEAEVRETGADQ